MHFIFMLTRDDRTVSDALAVYDALRDTDLHYVGFKDVGVDRATLRQLTERIQEDGREVMLEVVSTSREDELASVRAACQVGVDYLLGGTHVEDALALLDGSDVRYCPFPGTVVGHPSVLQGNVDEIVRHAAELTATDGVHGVDLLAYRNHDVDGAVLATAVAAAVDGPVIAAGNVDGSERIRALRDAGVWGFTIGSAIFAGRLPGAPDLTAQVRWTLGECAPEEAAAT